MDFIATYWLLILIVVALAGAIAWYIFQAARRTRVTGNRRDVLDEGAAPAPRNQALIDAPPATLDRAPLRPATPPSSPAGAPSAAPAGLAGAGEAVADLAVPPPAPAPAPAPAATHADDLSRIKGVGPKLVAQLHGLGVTSFAQIAAWNEADIDRIDAQLGRFEGRIRRDSWVEQAGYLAKDDVAGFAARFGATS